MVTRQLPLLAPRPRGCTLNAGELEAQRERLATLPSTVSAFERHGQALSVTFDAGVDEKMIDAIVATERECCPFLQISYDRLLRRLVIATATPEEPSALDLLGAALTGADKAQE
jgi:hypothetical protein